MNQRHRNLAALPILLVLFGSGQAAPKENRPINLVFILVDDLGATDLACFGSDFYETPNIDRFAKASMMFTNAYAASTVCSPTRAAIMTGRSPARLDMTIWHEGAVDGGPNNRRLIAADSNPNLPHEETTLAERLKSAGYRTAHFGKWHLGTASHYPETQGFDSNVGGTFWGAPATFFYPFKGPWSKSDPHPRYVPGLSQSKPGDFLPDQLTNAAIQWIQQKRDEPFFLNLWYYTVHSPIQAKQADIAHFRSKRKGKHHRDPTYAAMIKNLDDNVGRLLQTLKRFKLFEQTVIVFVSDNGGVDFDQRGIVPTSNYPHRSGKGTLYEGGIRVPMVVRWPGVTKPNTTCDQPVTSVDFVPTLIEGLQLPAPKNSHLDGKSLYDILSSPRKKLDRNTLFWHFPHYYPRMTPGSAVRHQDWKLIHYYEDDRVELFNLKNDPSEQHDAARENAVEAANLRRMLDAWRKRVGANAPKRNPEFRK